MSKRPSFVLYITDQHRADHLGCYGHPVLKTPNIDALATSGVVYDRFYVTSPVCMPNRASLMTCRMPSSHGVWTNGTPLSRHQVTFVELLRAAGYDTALIGKSHLQNFSETTPAASQPEADAGISATGADHMEAERSGFNIDDYNQELPSRWAEPEAELELPFYGFNHVDLVTGHGDGAGGAYARWLRTENPDADSLIGEANQLPHDYVCPQAIRTKVPEELYTTSWITDQAAKWIDARKDSDRPFFLMVSWPDPHHPFNPPGKFWDMYDPADMPVPAAFERNDWVPPDYVKSAIKAREAGKAFVKGFGSFACSRQEALEARALTCGMIAMVDEGVGKLENALGNTAQATDIVRIFTSDHGDHLGDHRLLLKGAEQYEQIARVPFIWTDPEGPSGTREAGIGQTHDIGSSILARARVQSSWGMQGQPLPIAGGDARDAALVQYDQQRGNPTLGPLPRVHTVRDERFRLSIFHGRDEGELFDLEKDPGEFENLWNKPAHAATQSKMLEKLARLEIGVADRLPLPRGLA